MSQAGGWGVVLGHHTCRLPAEATSSFSRGASKGSLGGGAPCTAGIIQLSGACHIVAICTKQSYHIHTSEREDLPTLVIPMDNPVYKVVSSPGASPRLSECLVHLKGP